MKHRTGLHLRTNGSLVSVAERAIKMRLPFFQSFLIHKIGKCFLWPTKEEMLAFRRLCRGKFSFLFAHGSFWINLAHTQEDGTRALKRELNWAKQCGFTHFVVHSGCAHGACDQADGIDAVARTLNAILKYEHDITIVLENTAHGNLSVGSDIYDFVLICQHLDQPEKVKFCIDTAHAHVYGYPLQTKEERERFIVTLDAWLGLDAIALLHVNDACDDHGSRLDRHACPGRGTIGEDALKELVVHPRLAHIPLILELPVVPESHMIDVLSMVHQWQ